MRVLLAATALCAALPALAAEGGFASELLGTGYLAPFVVLLLCGFGLPIPEEITMLGAGFLAYQGKVEFVPVILVCFSATLIGDSIPYFVGRRFGRRALRSRAVRRALHPERLRAIERRFERRGLAAIFLCRFLPGVRLPAWFTAGTLGVPYPKFLAVDALGAAIFTPTFVALGYYSGGKIAALEGRVEGLAPLLGFVALALAVGFVAHLVTGHRPRRKGLGGGRTGARRDAAAEARGGATGRGEPPTGAGGPSGDRG